MSRISKIAIYYRKKNGFFYGLKFYDTNGISILSVGDTKDSGLKGVASLELK